MKQDNDQQTNHTPMQTLSRFSQPKQQHNHSCRRLFKPRMQRRPRALFPPQYGSKRININVFSSFFASSHFQPNYTIPIPSINSPASFPSVHHTILDTTLTTTLPIHPSSPLPRSTSLPTQPLLLQHNLPLPILLTIALCAIERRLPVLCCGY